MIQNAGGYVYFNMLSDPNTPTVQISKNGGSIWTTATYSISTITSATNTVNGTYSLQLSTSETNTTGLLAIQITNNGISYYVTTTVLVGTVGMVAQGTVNVVTSNSNFTVTSSDLSSNDSDYVGMWLMFTSGNNKFIPRIIGSYTGATKQIQFTGSGTSGAFPETVVSGDAFYVLAGSN